METFGIVILLGVSGLVGLIIFFIIVYVGYSYFKGKNTTGVQTGGGSTGVQTGGSTGTGSSGSTSGGSVRNMIKHAGTWQDGGGGDIYTLQGTVGDPSACVTKCTADPTCQSFCTQTANGYCWMRDGRAGQPYTLSGSDCYTK